jgi:hypothetical protein
VTKGQGSAASSFSASSIKNFSDEKFLGL